MLRGLICALVVFATTAAYANAGAAMGDQGHRSRYGYSPGMTVSNATASASASVKTGLTVGVFGGEDMYRYWSGEATYLYRAGDLKLDGAGKSVSFGAHTHLITGDFLAHFRPRGAHIRPYISFGGGIEIMQGTGEESSNPPLKNLAALTATRENYC